MLLSILGSNNLSYTATSKTLTSNTEDIIETYAGHSSNTNLTIQIQFGTQGQMCRKIVQGISIYFERCYTFCISNDCP